MLTKIAKISLLLLLASCIGPDYKKPEIANLPSTFEAAERFSGINWKVIESGSDIKQGNWWEVFNDGELNNLISDLNQNNQSIKAALSNYQQSKLMIDQAVISYLPALTASDTALRQKKTSTHTITATGTWEVDLWGNIARTVESVKAQSEISAANLSGVKLSTQAQLVEYYYELVMINKNQELLNKVTKANQKIYDYTKNRYQAGVDSEQNLSTIKQQLENAKANSINNNIAREQYQNGIAVLVGKFPGQEKIPTLRKRNFPKVAIPLIMPSSMLERRPDVASSERAVAVASATIGITKSAFFPIFSIARSGVYDVSKSSHLFSLPITSWSKTIETLLNITNLATFRIKNKAAIAGYENAVANYRATVLAAFQDVENNISELAITSQEEKAREQAANSAHKSLKIALNQYKSGIIDQAGLLNIEINYYNSLITLNNISGQKTIASVSLIKSLGGGWN